MSSEDYEAQIMQEMEKELQRSKAYQDPVSERMLPFDIHSSDSYLTSASPEVDEERLREIKEKLKQRKQERIAHNEAEQARLEAEEQARRDAEEHARREAEEQLRLEAEEQARVEAEQQARHEAEEQARVEAEEQARQEAEEQARQEAEEQARQEAEEQARQEAEEQARQEAEEQARQEAEEQARQEAEEQARQEAEEQARQEAEEQARQEAEEQARQEAEEQARQEAEEQARQEAEEQARQEAEEQARQEAEEQARQEAEEQARQEAEEQARQEAEEQARQEAEEQARQEAEEQARQEAEEQARQEAEEQARQEAEEQARQEAEEQARQEAEEQARQEAEEQARQEAEEQAHQEAEEQARQEAEEQARQEAEEQARQEAEEQARQEAEEQARQEAEEQARQEAEEQARQEAEEQARQEAEEQARQEAEEQAHQEAEEQARQEAEEQARQEAEEQARQEAEEQARQEAEEQARQEAEEQAHQEAEEQARQEAEEQARQEAEEQARQEAEEQARQEAEEQARQEAEEQARQEAEEQARQEAEEQARQEAEEQARQEAEEQAHQEAEEQARQEAEEQARQEDEEQARIEAEEQARVQAEEELRQQAAEQERFVAEEEKARQEVQRQAAREAAVAEKVRLEAERAERMRVEIEEIKRRTREEVLREAKAKGSPVANGMTLAAVGRDDPLNGSSAVDEDGDLLSEVSSTFAKARELRCHNTNGICGESTDSLSVVHGEARELHEYEPCLHDELTRGGLSESGVRRNRMEIQWFDTLREPGRCLGPVDGDFDSLPAHVKMQLGFFNSRQAVITTTSLRPRCVLDREQRLQGAQRSLRSMKFDFEFEALEDPTLTIDDDNRPYNLPEERLLSKEEVMRGDGSAVETAVSSISYGDPIHVWERVTGEAPDLDDEEHKAEDIRNLVGSTVDHLWVSGFSTVKPVPAMRTFTGGRVLRIQATKLLSQVASLHGEGTDPFVVAAGLYCIGEQRKVKVSETFYFDSAIDIFFPQKERKELAKDRRVVAFVPDEFMGSLYLVGRVMRPCSEDFDNYLDLYTRANKYKPVHIAPMKQETLLLAQVSDALEEIGWFGSPVALHVASPATITVGSVYHKTLNDKNMMSMLTNSRELASLRTVPFDFEFTITDCSKHEVAFPHSMAEPTPVENESLVSLLNPDVPGARAEVFRYAPCCIPILNAGYFTTYTNVFYLRLSKMTTARAYLKIFLNTIKRFLYRFA